MKSAWALKASLVLVCLWLSAALGAQETQSEARFSPYNCEKWEARTRALANASDPVQQSLGELLQEPELSYCRTRTVRVQGPDKPDEPWFDWRPDFSGLAGLMQILAILLLAGLVLWLLSRLEIGAWSRRPEAHDGKAVPDDRSHELTARSEEDTDRVIDAAKAAWASGDRRRALSLLYRGALVRIWPRPRDRQARTEREVLEALKNTGAPERMQSTMRLLTRLWQQSAWAHRPPGDGDFAELCERWQLCFDDVGSDAE